MVDEIQKPPLRAYYHSLYVEPRSPFTDIVEIIAREMGLFMKDRDKKKHGLFSDLMNSNRRLCQK